MTEPIRSQIQAQIVWGDPDDLPVLAASHFLVQTSIVEGNNPRDVVLTIGYLPPPSVLGTPEQVREAVAAIDHLTVRPVARFSIPVGRATELRDLLGGMIAIVEEGSQQS